MQVEQREDSVDNVQLRRFATTLILEQEKVWVVGDEWVVGGEVNWVEGLRNCVQILKMFKMLKSGFVPSWHPSSLIFFHRVKMRLANCFCTILSARVRGIAEVRVGDT